MSEPQANQGFPPDLGCSTRSRSPRRISWSSTGDGFTFVLN
ncbi:hypothetical protein [Phormidium pseudopriestleyi]|nr:hypothetical protein [Phormidium pseudopriestleyi]